MGAKLSRYLFEAVVVLLVVFTAYSLYQNFFGQSVSFSSDIQKYDLIGTRVLEDFSDYPLVPIADDFTISDSLKDGIDIQFNGEQVNKLEDTINLSFPSDLDEPLAIDLGQGREITVTHNVEENYSRSLLTNQLEVPQEVIGDEVEDEDAPNTYVKYSSSDERVHTYYAYQKDQAAGYRNLKHWTIFEKGNGTEERSYTFQNAHLSINDRGEAELRYLPDNYQQNQETLENVDGDLLARAQAVLGEQMKQGIEDQPASLIIPAPYYLDSLGQQHTLEWEVNDTNDTISLSIETDSFAYPLALDPTLQFTAPGVSNSGDVIDGEGGGFGTTLTTGDFNADGKTDLAVGALTYSSNTGRVYVFYGGNESADVSGADVVLTGEGSISYFGGVIISGDFDDDGKDDIAVGAYGYLSNYTGRVYVFYGGSLVSENASNADVILTGEGVGDYFGIRIATGDFNADGKDDLVASATQYTSQTGRTYIFYGGSITTENASGADIILTGESSINYFGSAFTIGDFNNDGTDDLVVSSPLYSVGSFTFEGRTYIFYGGSMVSENASGADVKITGENSNDQFSGAIISGDFNNDGQEDLAISATGFNSNQGHTYVFYGGAFSASMTAGTDEDVAILGELTGDNFGSKFAVGDLNGDGQDDLVVGAASYSNTGRTYVFYGGSLVTSNATSADFIITGEGGSFGIALVASDLNSDGQEDLVVGASGYNSNAGRVYVFYSQSGQVNLNEHITGEGTSDYFGSAFATGDFNNDGREDLAVSSYNQVITDTGLVYIFYNDGAYPTGAGSADVTITGEASSKFGTSLVAGDFNSDGTIDLAAGAEAYSGNTGRVYIFYNDGSIPTTAATADVKITGGDVSNFFGHAIVAGDLNNDGTTDLGVGAYNYNTQQGRVYIFYNDGSIPTTAGTADVTITGEASSYFGYTIGGGDLDNDGSFDLVVGAITYSTSAGRVYIFYNDGSIPTTAATADVTIAAEGVINNFSSALATGDFNHDGRTDLAVGANRYSTYTGRVYIFYNDGSIPTTAATADVIITGETTNNRFGDSLSTGDLNNDGSVDLVVGATRYNSYTGKVYIYYGGTFTASMEAATSSSVMITGDSANDDFGYALGVGDTNNDEKDDLLISATGYDNNGNTGRVYLYQTREDYAWEIQRQSLSDGLRVDLLAGYEMKITGEPIARTFGVSAVMADFNNDGKDDLAIGAAANAENYGEVYIFYNDGNYPTSAGRADAQIGISDNGLGYALEAGDYNNDGIADLAIGAHRKGSYKGSVSIFYGSQNGISPDTPDVQIDGEADFSNFGIALRTGDFNADGVDDLVVGANRYSSWTGRAYIFYGGSLGSSLVAGTDDDVAITGLTAGDRLGNYLEVGDFNSDGTDDLVVSASEYNADAGRVYIFYGGSLGSTLVADTDEDLYIDGESGNDTFGLSMAVSDFNNDGADDLAVGAQGYGTQNGRIYIFYGDGSIASSAAADDATITFSNTDSNFGHSLTVGDFNSDGKSDLLVGASSYDVDTSTNDGAVFMFLNGDLVGTSTESDAEMSLYGETSSNSYGNMVYSGDLNNDGTDDILVGATGYNSNQGRLYFYTTNDRHITGEGTDSYFGTSFASGDYNNDGKTDLAVGASGYNDNNTGRVYIFYGGSKGTSTASGADVIITGEATSNQFGYSLATGDYNNDGSDDLAVGAYQYSSWIGRVYIFYGGSIVSENASGSDIKITGQAADDNFGNSITTGDFNNDGRDDLAVGASGNSTFTGRAYIFYGDGSIPTAAASADVIISGESTNNYFGLPLATGDFNDDGRDDLVAGAYQYSSYTGRAYIFYGDGSIPTAAASADVIISGESTNNYFGRSIVAGDFNDDGRDDLAVGASSYDDASGSNRGRAYIFYGDGSVPTAAASADILITGEEAGDALGFAIDSADLNADGTDDLLVGAYGYSTDVGRVYFFYGDELHTTGAGDANVIITGESSNSRTGSLLYTDDFDNNGVEDIVIAAFYYDDLDVTNNDEGRAYILMSEASAEHQSHLKMRGNLQFRGNVKLR